jgi:hypothetical protein
MSYIVCGWYTNDYRHWLDTLIPSLEAYGATHDFVEVSKVEGGWEANTCQKATQVQAAMTRHPDKTIIFLDVDCRVMAPLDELAAISGDVGVYLRTRFRSNGAAKNGWRSGTMVFKPNAFARLLVHAWMDETRNAKKFAVDQDSLAVAIGRVPGLSVTMLGVEWCAVPGDKCAAPKILHDSASRYSKTPRWRKWTGLAA